MRDKCPKCGLKKLKSETLCEDCLLSSLAYLRTPSDALSVELSKAKTNGKTIKSIERDIGRTVFDTDLDITDEVSMGVVGFEMKWGTGSKGLF